MKRFINSLLLIICSTALLWANEAEKPSQPENKKDYISCFTQWDNKLHTLQTHFIQTTEFDGLLISRSEGELSYQKDGSKLRLDNLDGEHITQTALTNKKKIWILDDKEKEISSLSWQEWSAGQPNKALFDFGNYTALIANHNATVLEYKQDTVLLKLTPKSEQENYTLYVAIKQSDCFPTDIRIVSDLMKTSAVLSDTQINTKLNEGLFKRIK